LREASRSLCGEWWGWEKEKLESVLWRGKGLGGFDQDELVEREVTVEKVEWDEKRGRGSVTLPVDGVSSVAVLGAFRKEMWVDLREMPMSQHMWICGEFRL